MYMQFNEAGESDSNDDLTHAQAGAKERERKRAKATVAATSTLDSDAETLDDVEADLGLPK